MTVHELITKLETFPRFMEVAFDFTPAVSNDWILAPVASVEQVNLGDESDIVLISRCDLSGDSGTAGLSDN